MIRSDTHELVRKDDIIECAEMLGFVADLLSHEPVLSAQAMEAFCPGYDVKELAGALVAIAGRLIGERS